MFIYKITVLPENKVYIGFDTHAEHKKGRWKQHCKQAFQEEPRYKLHKAMRSAGLENCIYEVIEKGFSSLIALALAEIKYIEKYDSYKNGLNSTYGGDGFGSYKSLSIFTEEEILELKKALGGYFREYNNLRWTETTPEQRKEMTSHLHTDEIYQQRSDTLKKFYEYNPDEKRKKGQIIKNWQHKNKEKLKANNKINGLKGAAIVSRKVILEKEDGTVVEFASISEFQRKTGLWFTTMLDKAKKNLYYKGYKLKE
jgi:hypothetical protein